MNIANSPNAKALTGANQGLSIKPTGTLAYNGPSNPNPMGVTAKTPTANVIPPASTLPKTQQNPIQPTLSTPTPQPLAVSQAKTPAYNPNQASDTVYQNGVGTVMQNSQAVTGGTPTQPVTPTQTTPTPANQPTQTPTTFPGLLGAAVNQQNSPYNTSATAGIAGLQSTAQTNPGTSGQAYTDYQTAVQNLAGLKSRIAAETAGNSLDNVPLDVQLGRNQATQDQYASQLDAFQQAVNQTQAALGYQIQGVQTQQAGYNDAAGQSLTGQGQVQGALQSAAGLAQPQLGSIGQVPFSPTDQSQGTVLGSTQPGGLQAAGNLLGQFNGAQALGAAPYQGQAAVVQAPYGAQASNINTQNTTGTNIAATGATQAIQQYNTLNAANSTFDNQAAQVLSVLQQGSLNGSIPDVNKAINQLGGKLGSTQVQALSSALTELGAAYTNLLSSNGGTPTAQDQQSLAALSPNSSAAQIATSIQQLKQAAQIKLQSAQSLAQGYGNALGGSTGSTGNGSTSGFGWNG